MSGVGMARSKKRMIQNKPNSAALKLARRACVVRCQALQFLEWDTNSLVGNPSQLD